MSIKVHVPKWFSTLAMHLYFLGRTVKAKVYTPEVQGSLKHCLFCPEDVRLLRPDNYNMKMRPSSGYFMDGPL